MAEPLSDEELKRWENVLTVNIPDKYSQTKAIDMAIRRFLDTIDAAREKIRNLEVDVINLRGLLQQANEGVVEANDRIAALEAALKGIKKDEIGGGNFHCPNCIKKHNIARAALGEKGERNV